MQLEVADETELALEHLGRELVALVRDEVHVQRHAPQLRGLSYSACNNDHRSGSLLVPKQLQ